jgi:DNA-binding response OmpR family regulator
VKQDEHDRRDPEDDENAPDARADAADESLFPLERELDDEGQQHARRRDDGEPGEETVAGEHPDQDGAEESSEPDGRDAARTGGHGSIVGVRTLCDRRFGRTYVAQLLILTSTVDGDVLPSLGLLSHRIRVVPAEPAALVNAPSADLILVDARHDLASAKSLCKILTTTGINVPLVLVLTEGGLTAVSADWGVDDFVLESAGPAEVEARIRLVIARLAEDNKQTGSKIQASGVVIDEASYSAKVHGKPLDLTFKEFELLRFLATHPSRVFTREQLLSEVWGYDYFGGTRTVDVHVRRLRAKLGDLESLIGTVRNVGYRFNVYDDEERLTPVS